MKRKYQLTEEGQSCKRCQAPVVKRRHALDWLPKETQWYWFDWWLVCPRCHAVYMVESAKVFKPLEPLTAELKQIAPNIWTNVSEIK